MIMSIIADYLLEPLLEPVRLDLLGIAWVIVGGESGPRARHMPADWARDVRDQCRATGVPLFMKQMGWREPIPADLVRIPTKSAGDSGLKSATHSD